ncbi:hypothetical protein L2Z47_03915 [Acinetobacter baumannii]|uniref:hypothetical protein n=1 Tax=Acinetobacter baumannii TaxID=470 RepID=UPI0004456A7B|nr:hypothetical protein [Acinetobacter baumannii]EKW4079193.1 hypothetical protein [Acinetobacter baumannii]EXD15086.1 hypothetical protein J479_2639 [Acinetobacter baumannii 1297]MBU0403814.1 hypothetical protein [Acinetobacter baumannii]MDC4739159.1 hypothetical protein [Acinetobacter baumannii]PPC16999.1 hypothetical protein AbaHC9436_15870 [Acinetobacter baumannii]
MEDNKTLAEVALELIKQNTELVKQTNKLIEQNTLIVQINAEQSAQLNELLAIFEEGEPVQKAKSLDG